MFSDGYSIRTNGGHWIHKISPGPSGGMTHCPIISDLSPSHLMCTHFTLIISLEAGPDHAIYVSKY